LRPLPKFSVSHYVILGLVPRIHTLGIEGVALCPDTGILDPRHKA